LLLFALLAPWTAQAQEELTVYEGTNTSSYVPAYMGYFDDFSRSQFVIPAEDLDEMNGGTISSIKFYTTSQNVPYTSVSTVDVYLLEVDYTSISAFEPKTNDAIVYQGTLNIVTEGDGGSLTIEFSTPYTYNGGNLLVAIENTTDAGYKFIYFYGQNVTGASGAGSNSSSLSGVTFTQRNFIPKTTFEYTAGAPSTCPRPKNLAASDVTANSAVLTWEAGGDETEWMVEYKTADATEWTLVSGTVNTPTYTLNGLTAATNYQARVQAACNEGKYVSTTFTTECDVINALGYTENFDSYTGITSGTTNNLPICWNYINTTSYSSYKGYPIVYGSSYSTGHSGHNYLYFYSYYSSYGSYDPQPQYAILPEMNGLAGTQVSLWAKGYNANSTFKIGTMNDPTDASTFVAITEQTLTTSYQQFEYLIPANAQGNYLAIMIDAANSSRTSNGAYIDDITIAEPPACPKPTDLTVVPNSVTPHSVQLSWVSDASAWIVAYKTAEEEEFTEVDATENPFTLTGLIDGKAYTAKVCAVCDGTPSEWTSTTVSFTTPIACPAPMNLACSGTTGNQTTLNWSGTSDSYDVLYRTAAYAEGFYEQFNTSGVPTGWTKYNGLVDEVIAGTSTLETTTSGWITNTNALGTYNIKVNIFGENCKYWLVTPEIDLSQNLSFDLALTKYNSADPIADPTAQADDRFVVLIYADEAWTILREWNNTGSEYVYNTIATTGEHVDINLSAYFGKTVKIAFYGESTESGGDNDLHIDNVLCGILHEAGEWQTAAEGVTGTTYTLTGLNPETDYEAKVLSNCEGETGHETVISFTTEAACMVPTELTVVSVTTTTAVLTWTSSSTAWQIQVNEEEPIDVTAIPYTLEGLTPATTYTFKVRSNCDGTYTDWSNAMSFATDCDAITTFPWSEDFENYSASSSGVKFEAPCWVNEHISGSGSYFFEVYSGTNGTNSTKQLRLRDMSSGTMTKLMLPEMTLPGTDYLFSIDVYRNVSTANYGEGIRVFVSTDGEIEGATELAFISRSYATSDDNLIPAETTSGWYTYELPIGISGTCYIILRGESLYGSSTYMDNFAVKQMPTCLKPTAFECTATTTTTATFSWTNGAADQTAWQICLNGDETNLIMADSNPFTIEDLSASTAYTAKVRAYCSEEDQSDWSNEVSFATDCEAIFVDVANPFTEGFDGDWTPLCWESIPYIDGTTTRQWTKTSSSSNIHTGAGAAYSGYYGPIYLVMPELQLGTDGAVAQLTFWSYNTWVSDYDKNSVVLLDGENEIELWSPESVAQSWEETTIDLTAYMGQTISLAFKYEGVNAHGWYIDDVEVSLASAPSTVTQTIELSAGWNRISIYVDVDPEDPEAAVAMLDMFKEGLGENGLVIEGPTGDFTEFDGEEWFGDLDEMGMYNEYMYMVMVASDCTVELEGKPADMSSIQIQIEPGWNRIGFPSSEEIDLVDALSDFESEEGDVIEDPDGYSEYDGEDWFGDVETLVPGRGYMYFNSTEDTKVLVFAAGGSTKSRHAIPISGKHFNHQGRVRVVGPTKSIDGPTKSIDGTTTKK